MYQQNPANKEFIKKLLKAEKVLDWRLLPMYQRSRSFERQLNTARARREPNREPVMVDEHDPRYSGQEEDGWRQSAILDVCILLGIAVVIVVAVYFFVFGTDVGTAWKVLSGGVPHSP